MMSEAKDSIVNVTTIVAGTSAMIDWTSALTVTLVITGIVFNVVRIIEVRMKMKKDRSEE
tara:strand:- start:453 stop:632 length:180 start_codon:yes stop_codon:yes gene_type:complete